MKKILFPLSNSIFQQTCRFILFALTVIGYNSVSAAQSMYADEFISIVKSKQNDIDLINRGFSEIREYFDLDNAEATAYESGDPDAYINYILARYYRVLGRMNIKAADIAENIRQFITDHRNDGTLSPVVINEGIAKYTELAEFFLENAKDAHFNYSKFWLNYSAKYGNAGAEYFEADDNFIKRYGVY